MQAAGQPRQSTALLQRVLAWRWPALLIWAAITCVGTYSTRGDWTYFAYGGRLLFGDHHVDSGQSGLHVTLPQPGGLHIFANYHYLQTGPLSLVLGGGLSHLGPDVGHLAGVALIQAFGAATLFLFERAALRVRRGDEGIARLWIPLTSLIGGFIFLQTWSEMSGRWAHLDDALAIVLAALACWSSTRSQPTMVGIALGLALASKPWAIGFAPIMLVCGRRDLGRAAMAYVATGLLAWAPFLLADWRTIQVGSFPLVVQSASPLSALGLDGVSLHQAAGWRILQFLLELLLVALVVRRRGWGAGLLACLATRLLLDPANYPYYEASLVAGAVAFDYMVWRRSLPAATLLAAGAWIVSVEVDRAAQGRLLFVCLVCALGLVGLSLLPGGRLRPALMLRSEN